MNMFDKAVLALPGAKRAFALCALAALARALLVAGQAYCLAQAIVALWGGASVRSQVCMLAGFAACMVGRQLVTCALDAWLAHYAAARAAELRETLLARVFSRGPALVAQAGTGNVASSALEGIDDVEGYIKLMLPKTSALVVMPVVLVVFAFATDWVSGLIMLVAFPVIVMFMILIGYNAQDAAAKRYAEFTQLANHFVDSLRGLDTLKAFGRSRAHAKTVFAISERFREATMGTLRIATLSSAILDLAATLALAAVAIMLGFRMTAGTVAFFPALFVLVLTPEYFKPIREFASDYHASLDGRTALAAINALIADERADEGDACEEPGAQDAGASAGADAATDTRADGATQQDVGEAATGHEAAGEGATAAQDAGRSARAARQPGEDATGVSGSKLTDETPLAICTAEAPHAPESIAPWGAHSTLELAGIGLAYDGHTALEDVSCAVEGYARVGIVGMSGSGKSTLARVLAGFAAPDAGRIVVDGRALESLHVPSWQQQVLFIPQNPYLFHASLRDNIAFYTPDATEAAIARAVACVGLDEFVAELPDGLDTLIGQSERQLSGGEAQRVALARALLDNTRRILLFDEPTAHLDIETELELKERMLPLMDGRLVFFATHRLHWVDAMDYLAVLENGRLAQFGTPAELAGCDGAYRRLSTRMGGAV